MRTVSTKDVSGYIAAAPREHQAKLKQLRSLIKKTAPRAEEKISYGMPYYRYKGRLAYFAITKKHIGLYIMPHVLADYTKDVKEYRAGKATLQFALDKSLPISLIKKLVKAGIRKNEARSI